MRATKIVALLSMTLTACALEGDGERLQSQEHATSDGTRARVAEITGEQVRFVEVPLEPFQGAVLSNALVRLDGVPGDLVPDERGCFCYPESDLRFAYVQTYVHATRAVETFNDWLRKAGLRPIEEVTIIIREQPPGALPNGSVDHDSNAITVYAPHAIVDPEMLVHEVAHVVDQSLRERSTEPPTDTAVPLEVHELAANLLGVLTLRGSKYIPYTALDTAIDYRRSDLRYPDKIVTVLDRVKEFVAAPRFSAAYPAYVGPLAEALAGADDPSKSAVPEAYANHPLVIGPLLDAAEACGFEPLQQAVVTTLRRLPRNANVGMLTPILVERTRAACPRDVADELEADLRARGVLPPPK